MEERWLRWKRDLFYTVYTVERDGAVPHHERGIRRQVALPDGRKLALSRVGEIVVALETEMVMPKGR
jgi:hypothetical protein